MAEKLPIDFCKCGNKFRKHDNFCSRCGAPRNSSAGRDEDLISDVVFYGPGIDAKYTCKKCKKSFLSSSFEKDSPPYCPNCGQPCEWND